MSTNKILILGASAENIFYIESILALDNVEVICVDKNPGLAPQFINKHHNKLKCITLDFSDIDKLIDLVKKEHITHSIALPVGRSLTTLGKINDIFNFAGPCFKAIDILTDKVKFHDFCSQLGINQSAYLTLENGSNKLIKDNIALIEEKFEFPLIIKPSYGSGSLGVRKIYNIDQVLQYETPERFIDSPLLFEQMIQGTEYSTNLFVDASGSIKVLGLLKKEFSPPPFCQEAGYFIDDYSDIATLITKDISKIVTALDIKMSFINADIIISKGKAYIVDISPRLPGNNILRLLKLLNKNPIQLYAQEVLNQDPIKTSLSSLPKDLTLDTNSCAVLRFFNFNSQIHYGAHSLNSKDHSEPNLEHIFTKEELTNILELKNNLKIGHNYGPMTCGIDTGRGYILAQGSSLDSADIICQKYLKALQDF